MPDNVFGVGKKMIDKYAFGKYLNEERWASYWQQIREILACGAKRVLEIGPGDKVVADCFKKRFAGRIFYQTADIDKNSEPDIVSSVEEIKVEDGSYELVCAFEVLEHLPFEKFDQILAELFRVSERFVILSLPHWGRHFSGKIRLPFVKIIKWQFKFSLWHPEHRYQGEHYWEIGKKGYPLRLIKAKMVAAGFEIKKDYIAFESPYHHFFVLEK